MNTREFIVTQAMSANTEYIDTIKKNTFDHIDRLLGTKGAEYSSDTNRFENFLDAGRSENMPPEKALWYMMLKHYISIRKFVMELVTDRRRSVDKWSEKIDDMIAYLILLKAMIRRRTHIEQVIEAGQAVKLEDKRFDDEKSPAEEAKIAGEKEAEKKDTLLGGDVNNDSLGRDIGQEGPGPVSKRR